MTYKQRTHPIKWIPNGPLSRDKQIEFALLLLQPPPEREPEYRQRVEDDIDGVRWLKTLPQNKRTLHRQLDPYLGWLEKLRAFRKGIPRKGVPRNSRGALIPVMDWLEPNWNEDDFDRMIEQQIAAVEGAQRNTVFSNDKVMAAWLAWELLVEYGFGFKGTLSRPPKHEWNTAPVHQWIKLAAILYGNRDTDFLEACRAVHDRPE